jgi:hypothetical protein
MRWRSDHRACLPLGGPNNAMDMLTSGNPNIAGSFTRQADLAGVNSAEDMIARLRLDYDGSTPNGMSSPNGGRGTASAGGG